MAKDPKVNVGVPFIGVVVAILLIIVVIMLFLSGEAHGQAKPKVAATDTLVTRALLIEQRERAVESRQRLVQQLQGDIRRAEAEMVGLRFQIQSYRNHADSLIRVNKSELLEE